ncbi:MAG: hypothetical protein K0S34_428 [Bacillales bacterium]|jgi:hypothetical protein|nr:hypothetical protein [Bacillales bacterium]
MKIKSKWIFILIILQILFFYNYSWIKYLNYSLTPVKTSIFSPKKIKDDLNFIYYGKYKIYSVDSYGNQPNSCKGKLVNIFFTDYSSLLTHEFRGKEKLLTEAIYIQYFIAERNLDKNIHFVNYLYKPNMGYYSMAGEYTISINTKEFKELYNKYKAEGFSNEQTLLKLSLFYSNRVK